MIDEEKTLAAHRTNGGFLSLRQGLPANAGGKIKLIESK